ncbi:hypothetical protein HW561_00565 [Rhodobacteraceae bacterium B1Z28]|uniref:Uncharacterized protein n=1 Tax=Ruegeria haliotis TaxID=2747601 RepID=A0ABX2PJJ1_9RHOB|nr:hypothetical protein [Ruegeria haliotis]NVO54282.1 hypothetical protein [Ruegeria haliotis]
MIKQLLQSAIVLFVLTLTFFWSAGSSESEQPEAQHELFAAGGKWVAQDISWVEYKDHWRVRTLATLVELRNGPLLFTEALRALCDEVIVNLPNAPSEVSQEDVYRVELNIRSFLPGDNRSPAFSQAIPIQVRREVCQMKPDGELYFNSYPAQLEDWEVTKVLYGVEESGEHGITLHFRAIDSATSGKLPFMEACNAFFADPSPALGKLKQLVELPDDLSGYRIKVAMFDDPDVSVAFNEPADYGIYVYKNDDFQVFKLSKEQCISWPESASQ